MKTILAVMALLAMVGFAAAFDSLETLTYTYTKDINYEAGEELGWLNGATSGAQSSSCTNYGQAKIDIDNKLCNVDDNLKCIGQKLSNTEDTLTQEGVGAVYTAAGDYQKPCEVKMAGFAKASQEVTVSGLFASEYCWHDPVCVPGYWEGSGCFRHWVPGYTIPGYYDTVPTTPAVEASMQQCAVVGIDGFAVKGVGEVSGTVNTGISTKIVDANIGQSTSVGFEQLQAVGAKPLMSGETTGWAGFSGAFSDYDGVCVTTDVDVHGDFNKIFNL